MPGIQPADVQELIEHGATAVVLSKGIWERLQVCPETLEVLDKNGIQIEVLQTEDEGPEECDLESRCAIIRTAGSNPTLSANIWLI